MKAKVGRLDRLPETQSVLNRASPASDARLGVACCFELVNEALRVLIQRESDRWGARLSGSEPQPSDQLRAKSPFPEGLP